MSLVNFKGNGAAIAFIYDACVILTTTYVLDKYYKKYVPTQTAAARADETGLNKIRAHQRSTTHI